MSLFQLYTILVALYAPDRTAVGGRELKMVLNNIHHLKLFRRNILINTLSKIGRGREREAWQQRVPAKIHLVLPLNSKALNREPANTSKLELVL